MKAWCRQMDKKEGEHDYFFNMNGTPLGENSASRSSSAVSGGLSGLWRLQFRSLVPASVRPVYLFCLAAFLGWLWLAVFVDYTRYEIQPGWADTFSSHYCFLASCSAFCWFCSAFCDAFLRIARLCWAFLFCVVVDLFRFFPEAYVVLLVHVRLMLIVRVDVVLLSVCFYSSAFIRKKEITKERQKERTKERKKERKKAKTERKKGKKERKKRTKRNNER